VKARRAVPLDTWHPTCRIERVSRMMNNRTLLTMEQEAAFMAPDAMRAGCAVFGASNSAGRSCLSSCCPVRI
jgi:hypothetical protein